MSRSKSSRILLLLLCVGFSYLLAAAIRNAAAGAIKAIDFGEVYYGAKCALEHKDPYQPQTVFREFETGGGRILKTNPREEQDDRTVISVAVYPPTTFFLAAPLAMLPWSAAREIWLILTCALLVAAAFLMCGMAPDDPTISAVMACFILLNSYVLLVGANPAGIAIPLGLIATWCFLKNRYAVAGVLMLAMSLVLKPHDVGFVWLYFLLAGGAGRKRALQTLAVAAVLGLCAALWIAPRSPHWTAELHRNLTLVSTQGNTSDPGPTGPSYRSFFQPVNLQTAVSVFSNDPHVYNLASYLIGGGLILAWAIVVVRRRLSREGTLLALAAISILSLLPVYHRPYDAKLLLLAIPGCAMLWAGKGSRRRTRWLALGLTSAAIFFTSDIPLTLWTAATGRLPISASTPGVKALLMLSQPAPLLLLATGCFYLWAFIRYRPSAADAARLKNGALKSVHSAAN